MARFFIPPSRQSVYNIQNAYLSAMRVLHTSDWHLGHRLYDREQRQEQQMALDWLLNTISEQAVDLLIIAGDIFDNSNPSNYARQQYYEFLGKLQKTSCRHVVIIGGNHDSPSMLNATSAVLKYINITVIGAATEDLSQQLIKLKDNKGKLEALVAAVPFLRDRDIHYNQAGENEESRTTRLRQAIRQHYQALGDLAEKYAAQGIPIITTGHLYAHGSKASDKRSKIYIGNRSNIAADDFPAIFDYVALGHIHRPQKVGGLEHVRYSGSMIPLDFSEVADDKIICLIDFLTNEVANTNDKQQARLKIETQPIPSFRRLKRIEGSIEEVKTKLDRFLSKRAMTQEEEKSALLAPWIEVKVLSDRPILLLREQLEAIVADRSAEIISIQVIRQGETLSNTEHILPKLDELSVEDVFRKLCQGNNGEVPDNYPFLLDAFRALENWRQEKEDA